MYIINNYVFGHELANSPELNEKLCDFDIEFSKSINGKRYEVSAPYHGGQVAGDVQSVIIGTVVTDDDGNKLFAKEIKNAKVKDYKSDYKLFIDALVEDLVENKGQDDDYDEFVDKLIVFLKNTKPDFYLVESSS